MIYIYISRLIKKKKKEKEITNIRNKRLNIIKDSTVL